MLKWIAIVLFVCVFVWAVKLVLKLAWGTAKIVASALLVAALPLLIVCALFASGVLLFVPVALVVGMVVILYAGIKVIT